MQIVTYTAARSFSELQREMAETTPEPKTEIDLVFWFGLAAICAAICVFVLVWALWSYFRHGREYAPDFTDEYSCTPPDSSLHPALIGRLWRWNRPDWKDLIVTLMRLEEQGSVRIDEGVRPQAEDEATTNQAATNHAESPDYCLTRLPQAAPITNSIDRAALSLVFDCIAGGSDVLWVGSIEEFAKQHAQEFIDAEQSWKDTVAAEVEHAGFFEKAGKRRQKTMLVVAAVLAALGIVAGIGLLNPLPPITMVVTAIAIAVIANYMPRRSKNGNNLVARCKAFRNWIGDYQASEEDQQPLDAATWDEYMPYAYLFEVGDEAVEQAPAASRQQWLVGSDPLPSVGTLLEADLVGAEAIAHDVVARKGPQEPL